MRHSGRRCPSSCGSINSASSPQIEQMPVEIAATDFVSPLRTKNPTPTLSPSRASSTDHMCWCLEASSTAMIATRCLCGRGSETDSRKPPTNSSQPMIQCLGWGMVGTESEERPRSEAVPKSGSAIQPDKGNAVRLRVNAAKAPPSRLENLFVVGCSFSLVGTGPPGSRSLVQHGPFNSVLCQRLPVMQSQSLPTVYCLRCRRAAGRTA